MQQAIFEKTMSKSHAWLNELQEQMGMSDKDTYTAFRATMHQLRDRLTVEEATDLASQLPTLLKGIYFEEYNPAHKPEKIDDKIFVSRVHASFANRPEINPRNVVKQVFHFLDTKLTNGQKDHLKATLPQELVVLWP